jgi:hypothetical protein
MSGSSSTPLIVYVRGLKPKPAADIHRRELVRCLTEGIRRVDADLADDIGDAFHLVSWTFDFYGEHRDINLDIADIDTILTKTSPSEKDLRVVTSWKRRFARWLFKTADYLPFLIPHFATEEIEIHLRDFHRYLRNNHGISEAARQKVKSVLIEAAAAGRPVLVFGHSMGSVIVYESLWQLSREENIDVSVDLLTTGSPLGQTIVQRHLMGSHREGVERFPSNIRQWVNIAAIGELTAIDRTLKNDFAEMVELGLLNDIDDRDSFNYYHMHGALNVHAEYGYLINEVTAGVISRWWREKSGAKPDPDSA